MLFNSYVFIFLYLPVVLVVFQLLSRLGLKAALNWLTCASMVFYGYWNVAYVGLLLASIGFNYLMARAIHGARTSRADERYARLLLAIAVLGNLSVLGYFKYRGFVLENLGAVTGWIHAPEVIVLPLGISFFTFTQIAFLVDTYRWGLPGYPFLRYALFVSYFPHLIAGPILHHRQFLPQLEERERMAFSYSHLAVGLTIFSIGLFKKIVLADGMSAYADPVFFAAYRGFQITFMEAWVGALAYTLQLYFDFSGYSDMAIGLSWLFGLRLPENFASPYKATSIIEFWRRWHITLSRFLRDYLYIPLGGNREGAGRTYINLLVTAVLGGLWHGAGWTFVLWGGIHGIYLVVNHAWRRLRGPNARPGLTYRAAWKWLAWTLTFGAVVAGWVVFRSATVKSAWTMIRGMLGMNGFSPPRQWEPWLNSISWSLGIAWIVVLLVIVVALPNTQQVMARFLPRDDAVAGSADSREPMVWRPNGRWAACVGIMLACSILYLHRTSQFLYFQF